MASPTREDPGFMHSLRERESRGGQIRTDDILLPKQALYQAELRPVTRRSGGTIGVPDRGGKTKALPPWH